MRLRLNPMAARPSTAKPATDGSGTTLYSGKQDVVDVVQEKRPPERIAGIDVGGREGGSVVDDTEEIDVGPVSEGLLRGGEQAGGLATCVQQDVAAEHRIGSQEEHADGVCRGETEVEVVAVLEDAAIVSTK